MTRARAAESLHRGKRRRATRLESFVDRAPVVVWAVDHAGCVTLARGRGLERFGVRAAEVLGRPVRELVGDVPEAVAAVERVLAGQEFTVTLRGRGLAFETSCLPERDVDGTVIGAAGIAFDVSERAQAEGRLHESERRYESVVAALAEGVLLLNADGTIRACNRAAETLLGRRAAQLVGQPLSALGAALREDGTPMPEPERPAEATRRTGRRCSNVVVGLDRPGAERVWLRINTEPLLEGAEAGTHAVVASLADITETRQAADAVSVLSSAVEQTADHVFITDRAGQILYVNPAFEAHTGYSMREVLGTTPRVLKSGRHAKEFYDEMWAALAAGQVYRGTFVNRRKDGSLYHEEKTITPIRDARGGITHFVSTGRDVTERLRAEETQTRLRESLRHSETMSAMGRLVAGVAHEVRNPLFGISAIADAFDAEAAGHEVFREYGRMLRGEVERLSHLMQELLNYGRPNPPDLSLTSLRAVLERALSLTARRARGAEVELALEAPEDLPEIVCDPARLCQVFQNLLDNAVQHAPRGSRVALRATGHAGDDEVTCLVLDAGAGFKPEDIPRVFDPFFTRRRGGTGLGLAIVQRIVLEHGGRVAARNRDEGGACLEVALRCGGPPPAALE